MEALWALLVLAIILAVVALAALVVRAVWTAGRRRQP